MQTTLVIIFFIFVATFVSIVLLITAAINRSALSRAKGQLEFANYRIIENVKVAGYIDKAPEWMTKGAMAGLPTNLGFDACTLYVNDQFILIDQYIRISIFFRFQRKPFILANNPYYLTNKSSVAIIAKPLFARIANHGSDVEIFIYEPNSNRQIRAELVFSNIKKRDIDAMYVVWDWCEFPERLRRPWLGKSS